MKKIILNLGSGTLEKGCETVIGEILDELTPFPIRFTGSLPAAPQLLESQRQWQRLYAARFQDHRLRIHLLEVEGLRYSESAFNQVCATLIEQFNHWLSSPAFLPIDRLLRTELKRDEDVQIIVETGDAQLRKLPWHGWQLLADYPYADCSFSAQNWRPLNQLDQLDQRNAQGITSRVLVTLGTSAELNLAADLKTLRQLKHTDLGILTTPTVQQLHEKLWQPEGWDIFFFAGHSQTCEKQGIIALNSDLHMSIDQLKHALGKAIDNGLKIAIFNSCDGLGLAHQLSELQIPYIVVMKEPVPDQVAQQFLHYLLAAFTAGRPLHLAVKEARQRLAGLENEIPCASWLPVIWQNPTAPAVYWGARSLAGDPNSLLPGHKRESLLYVPATDPAAHGLARATVTSLAAGLGILGLRAMGWLMPVELAAFDHLMRRRPPEPLDPRIVLVEITEATTSQYGYPLPDEALTQLVDRLSQAQPLAIGIDLHRAKPTPAGPEIAGSENSPASGGAPSLSQSTASSAAKSASRSASQSAYDRFLEQVRALPNLFLVCFYGSTDSNYRAPLELSEQLRIDQVGFSDLPSDGGEPLVTGIRSDLSPPSRTALIGAPVRRQILSYDPDLVPSTSTCITPYSFSFQLAYQYLWEQGVSPLEINDAGNWQLGRVEFQPLPQRYGAYQRLEAPSDQLMINYRANQPGQTITFEQLLAGDFDPQMFRDRIVIVGYTAPVSKDYVDTPYGPMAGMWVHGHMVSQLLSAVIDGRPLIRPLPQWRSWQWGDMLWILVWASGGGYLGWVIKRPSRWLLAIIVGGASLYVSCWVGLVFGLWVPMVPAGLAAVSSSMAIRLARREEVADGRPLAAKV